MAWIEKRPPQHECDPPVVGRREAALGSTWACDHCGQMWRIDAWTESLPGGLAVWRTHPRPPIFVI